MELQRAAPPFGGFLTVPLESLRRIFVSPGPVYDAVSFEVIEQGAKAFYAGGFDKDDIVINTYSYHLVPAGLLLDESMQLLGATVIPTGVGNSELQVQIMHDSKVTGYVGTPSFLMTLAQNAVKEKFGILLEPEIELIGDFENDK